MTQTPRVSWYLIITIYIFRKKPQNNKKVKTKKLNSYNVLCSFLLISSSHPFPFLSKNRDVNPFGYRIHYWVLTEHDKAVLELSWRGLKCPFHLFPKYYSFFSALLDSPSKKFFINMTIMTFFSYPYCRLAWNPAATWLWINLLIDTYFLSNYYVPDTFPCAWKHQWTNE